MESYDDIDTSLERVLVDISELLKKQYETSKSINENLEMLFASDMSRQETNKSMRTVLKDSIEYFSSMQETYEFVPLLLDNISKMHIENQGILNRIYELLDQMKDKHSSIKQNMPARHSSAPYLNLLQEEFLEGISYVMAIDTDMDSEHIFNRMVKWGADIQRDEKINLHDKLREDDTRQKYWIKFLVWLRKEFNNTKTLTIIVIHAMYTVYVTNVTASRLVDVEAMQTLLKFLKQALQKGES